jgi:ferritin-like metal-binding protein YciE
MRKEELEPMALPLSKLEPKQLRSFFITHLDHIYAAKKHVLANLPQLANLAHFTDLRNSILEIYDEITKQLRRMDVIYSLLDTSPGEGSHGGWVGLIDNAFAAVQENFDCAELRDLAIIFHMQNIESLETASFKVLQMAAVKLRSKDISQLLKENYDEANSDRLLLLLIMSKYIAG